MNPSECPKRIHLNSDDNGFAVSKPDMSQATWSEDRIFSGDVEYIRADCVGAIAEASYTEGWASAAGTNRIVACSGPSASLRATKCSKLIARVLADRAGNADTKPESAD